MEAIIAVILPAVIAALLSRFKICTTSPTPAKAKQYAQEHYDESSDEFDAHAIRRERKHVKRVARKHGYPNLSWEQVDQVTEAAFREGLEADEAKVQAAMAAAPDTAE